MRYVFLLIAISTITIFGACGNSDPNSQTDNDRFDEGCGSHSKGVVATSKADLKDVQQFITCDEVETYYPNRNYNMEALDSEVLSKIKLKLIEDGTAPEWAPKTITVTGMIGCVYYSVGLDSNCLQGDPLVFYGSSEPDIKQLETTPKTVNPLAVKTDMVDGNNFRVDLNYETGIHKAFCWINNLRKEFTYTNQDATDDSDVQPDEAVQKDADTATDAEITD